MKLQLLLLAAVGTISSIHALDGACPGDYCGNDVANTEPTVDASVACPDLEAVTLASFTYDGNPEYLIELRGPANLADAADLVITAPHGGDLTPAYVPDRDATGIYCPTGCKTVQDSYTKQISELLQEKFIANYCKVPFLVINHLHRSKLDANREVGEAAQGNAIAQEAWLNFHTFIRDAQVMLRDRFGTSQTVSGTGSVKTGIHALLFDIHGYTGYDWVSDGGSPMIQWGFRFSDTSLEFCPLDSRSEYTIGTYTHARWMDGHSYECLVRGPGSLASRVNKILLEAPNPVTADGDELCGQGLPSYEYPSPQTMMNDPAWCEDMTDAVTDECYYYSGGYDTMVHERLEWQDENELGGDHMNAVQAEFPRCIRFGGDLVREDLADKLSVATMRFLRDLYGSTDGAAEDSDAACNDGADNDWDGLVDCDDPGCANTAPCSTGTTTSSMATTTTATTTNAPANICEGKTKSQCKTLGQCRLWKNTECVPN